MRGRDSMFREEEVFNSEKDIKYYFQKSFKKSSNLIIVFSAFSPVGKPPKYNYVNTLEGFDCNKLFILDDFGPRATYYLCENRDFTIERSIINLIRYIMKKNDIKTIMSCGSSKGGYAALYYGIKYGFEHVIVASPQYYVGDYLLVQTNSHKSAKFMSGSDTDDDRLFLNQIMKEMIIESIHKPNIFIHLGKGEWHYNKHVKPLLNQLDERNIGYQLDLGDYSNHNEVIKYYPQLIKSKVREIYHYPLLEMDRTTAGAMPLNSTFEFKVTTDSEENKIAWYLYYNGKRIDYKKYSSERTYNVNFSAKGKYYVKAFALNEKQLKTSLKTKIVSVN